MQVSKNIWRGGLITDLNVISKLAKEGKSIVWCIGTHNFIRPAAFIQNWRLKDVMEAKLYYAIKESEIE